MCKISIVNHLDESLSCAKAAVREKAKLLLNLDGPSLKSIMQFARPLTFAEYAKLVVIWMDKFRYSPKPDEPHYFKPVTEFKVNPFHVTPYKNQPKECAICGSLKATGETC